MFVKQGNLIVLPDNNFERKRWILWLGAYATDKFLVWGSLDDAFEQVVEWAAEHAPGHLCDDEVQEEYNRAIAEGKSDEEAREIAEVDTSCASANGLHYVNSWEWGIYCENPTRDDIIAARD